MTFCITFIDSTVWSSVSITSTFGAAWTVKEREAGVESTYPAGSVARTKKVWEPSASSEVVLGETQLA